MFQPVGPVEIAFYTATTPEDARKLIVSVLHREGGETRVDSDKQIVAGFGSGTKARMLGTTLGGIKVMPRDVVIDLERIEENTMIKVSVRDTFGFGTRVGIADKLQELMRENAFAIRSAFPNAVPAPIAVPEKQQLDQPRMICPKCGTDVPTGSTSCPNCGAEFVFVPQPVTAPLQPMPQPMYVRPPKDRSVALILEILPGLFGFLGFGWIYAGNTNTGVAILVSYFIAEVLFVISDVASSGLCCFITLPISIAAIALSASKLNTYTKTRTDLFGP